GVQARCRWARACGRRPDRGRHRFRDGVGRGGRDRGRIHSSDDLEPSGRYRARVRGSDRRNRVLATVLPRDARLRWQCDLDQQGHDGVAHGDEQSNRTVRFRHPWCGSDLEPHLHDGGDVLLLLHDPPNDVGSCGRLVAAATDEARRRTYWRFEMTLVASAGVRAFIVLLRTLPSLPSSRSTCIATSSFGASVTLTRSYSPIV